MIRGRCPTCSKSYAIDAIADLPSFPFCSARCRLVDLGRWVDGRNAIPGPAVAQRQQDDQDDSSDDDDD
jgi:endogenous inhibitor of DNA gyrase (YacG/DUF329 family)